VTDTPQSSPPVTVSPPPSSPSRPDPTLSARQAPRRPRWTLPVGVILLLALAVTSIVLLRTRGTETSTAATPAAAVPDAAPVIAETVGEEGHLAIAVVSLDRVAPDTVELRVAVTNTSPAGSPALDIAQRFSADTPDRGTLAEVYLADLTHERKFFVLRDRQDVPLGSRDDTPLAAGERRVLWARYPAPAEKDAEVVVHVPHAEPLPNIPVGQRMEPSTP
jgi:hypothetical protein